ncbi:hypothetical protein SADUNF_Sadunf05G0141000 [Salix dunnii]|uniref:Uncharacterized protein n=1 Tax=Salix dunnii TaxID=1413687 RepID=A0A835K8D1_9ROSI|nr:hypothetical protein SADUNF_Sadunf05G0141000 [Salix dunnii]
MRDAKFAGASDVDGFKSSRVGTSICQREIETIAIDGGQVYRLLSTLKEMIVFTVDSEIIKLKSWRKLQSVTRCESLTGKFLSDTDLVMTTLFLNIIVVARRFCRTVDVYDQDIHECTLHTQVLFLTLVPILIELFGDSDRGNRNSTLVIVEGCQITGPAFSLLDPDYIYIQGIDYEVIAFKATTANLLIFYCFSCPAFLSYNKTLHAL